MNILFVNEVTIFHYILYLFLFTSSAFCQSGRSGGGGSGGIYGGRGGSLSGSKNCDSCCEPQDPTSNLTVSIYTPVSVIVGLILFYVMLSSCPKSCSSLFFLSKKNHGSS